MKNINMYFSIKLNNTEDNKYALSYEYKDNDIAISDTITDESFNGVIDKMSKYLFAKILRTQKEQKLEKEKQHKQKIKANQEKLASVKNEIRKLLDEQRKLESAITAAYNEPDESQDVFTDEEIQKLLKAFSW